VRGRVFLPSLFLLPALLRGVEIHPLQVQSLLRLKEVARAGDTELFYRYAETLFGSLVREAEGYMGVSFVTQKDLPLPLSDRYAILMLVGSLLLTRDALSLPQERFVTQMTLAKDLLNRGGPWLAEKAFTLYGRWQKDLQRIYQTPEVAQRRELYLSLEKEARSYLIPFLQKIRTP
jgi:hypothetical protein